MAKLLVTDAIIRARNLGFIARENKARTRLWFYNGQEEAKSEWIAVGNIEIQSRCLVDLGSFELALK